MEHVKMVGQAVRAGFGYVVAERSRDPFLFDWAIKAIYYAIKYMWLHR